MYTVVKNIIYIHQRIKETKTIDVYREMKSKLPKQRCHAIKLKCKATYFYTLACTQAHPWMHAYGNSHALNNTTPWGCKVPNVP